MSAFDVEQFKVEIDGLAGWLIGLILYLKKFDQELPEFRIANAVKNFTYFLIKFSPQPIPPAAIDKFKVDVRQSIELFAADLSARKLKSDSWRDYPGPRKSLVKEISRLALVAYKGAAGDALAAFIGNWLEVKEGAFASKDAIYDAYLNVCRRDGIEPVPKSEFGKILRARLPHVRTVRKRVHGQRTYGWENIRLKKAR